MIWGLRRKIGVRPPPPRNGWGPPKPNPGYALDRDRNILQASVDRDAEANDG